MVVVQVVNVQLGNGAREPTGPTVPILKRPEHPCPALGTRVMKEVGRVFRPAGKVACCLGLHVGSILEHRKVIACSLPVLAVVGVTEHDRKLWSACGIISLALGERF